MRVAALEREIKRDKRTAEMDAGDEPRLERERRERYARGSLDLCV